MSRLVLFLFAIGMLSGCSGPAAQEPKTKEPGKNELPASAKPAQVAEDFIAGSWKGSEFDILAVKEQPTSLRKTSAVAVYVQWKIRGEEEARHELLLVQEGRVRSSIAFDVNKSLEENVSAAVHQYEAP